MNFVRLRFLRFFVVNSVSFVTSVALLLAAPDTSPRLFLLEAAALQSARAAVAQHRDAVTPAWTALKADADKTLALERLSVVDKTTRTSVATVNVTRSSIDFPITAPWIGWRPR